MSITYKVLSVNEITSNLLKGYERYTKTTHVYRWIDGALQIIPEEFEEDWSETKLMELSLYLKDCAARGGVVIVAVEDNHVVGFGNLESNRYFDTYIHLPYLHVSRPNRGTGIGRMLLQRLEQEARLLGGKKLYISSHPSVESQAFYQSVGCVVATHIIPELLELEPLDIQLEKDLLA